MKISVTVKPGAKVGKVERLDAFRFKVWVKEPAREGRANQGVIRALSEYFKKPKSCFSLCRGEFSKQKIFEVKE